MGWDGITPLRLRQLLLQLLKELNVGKHITSLLELQVICPSSGRLNPSNAIWVTIGALFEIVLTKKLKWFFVRKVLISVMNMSANAVYIQIWHQSYPAQDIFPFESSLSDCNHPLQFDLGRPNLCQRALLPTTSGLQPPDLIICCHQLHLAVIWCHHLSLLSSGAISYFCLSSGVINFVYLSSAVINFLTCHLLLSVVFLCHLLS